MNYKIIGKILGKIMILEGVLMLAPLVVSFVYNEALANKYAFIIPMILLFSIGIFLQTFRLDRNAIYQKEGFALTALVWFVMPFFGALPFVINGDIPSFIDAFFEITSGFTTTGASIITDITAISHSSLFWRSFSHWIGGMGILVFVLIFIPESDDGSAMHLLRAESPGPQVGKLVSRMKATTGILYMIYFGLTIAEIFFLMLDQPVPGYEGEKIFFSFLTAFGCAGTGGFGFIPESMAYFSPYSQYVISIFLILFGVNFGLYYLLLLRKFKEVFKSEEFRSYFLIVLVSVALIFISLVGKWEAYPQSYTVEESFRHALFQVASIITTAGFTTTDYHTWPALATAVLFVLMFIGGMAGSTAGGMKTSRIVIAVKALYTKVRKLINPRHVAKTKFEGKTLSESTVNDVFSFITMYLFILVSVFFLLSFDPVNGTTVTIVSDAGEYTVKHNLFSSLSSVLACISNVGPAFEAVGPYSSFAGYTLFSKLLLSFTMILGRLEILPVLLLFSPKTWKKT